MDDLELDTPSMLPEPASPAATAATPTGRIAEEIARLGRRLDLEILERAHPSESESTKQPLESPSRTKPSGGTTKKPAGKSPKSPDGPKAPNATNAPEVIP